MHVLESLVLVTILIVLIFGKCQEVDENELKESDIINITVEKKDTTKSLPKNVTTDIVQTPMTILPFKNKSDRHTLPVNMVEPSNKPLSKISKERTLSETSIFETENFEMDLKESENDEYSERNLATSDPPFDGFSNDTVSLNHTTDNSLESINISTSRNDSILNEEIDQNADSAENDSTSGGFVTSLEASLDTNVNLDNATMHEEHNSSYLKDYGQLCEHSGNGRLQYVWGDAFSNTDCLGPNMQRYPKEIVDRMFQEKWKRLRQKRETSDPLYMRDQLLSGWLNANRKLHQSYRMMKSSENEITDNTPKCPGQVKKLCQSDYNTTAPMFGMSMTTGQPVAIVQKFPDLLQQVIYEVCLSEECAVVHGKCTNTYIPYLFLTIPLGPVTLTGQDYILVESGCSCKPDP